MEETYIAVVLDRSGSMAAIKDATIKGFNEFVAGQKAIPGSAKLKLIQFDHEYQVSHDGALSATPTLTEMYFVPRGTTALLDAAGKAITGIGQELMALSETERPKKVIVAIITDGLENASQEYTREKVFQMISHQQDVYKWEFLFLGAGQDAIAEAAKIGINVNHAMSYAATAQGVQATMCSVNNAVGEFRAGQRYAFTKEERARAAGLQKTGK